MKEEKFQKIIEDFYQTEQIWDWDEQDCAVDENLDIFLMNKPSPSQIAEYINVYTQSYGNVFGVYNAILNKYSSVETVTTIIKTLPNLEDKNIYSDDISKVFIKILDEHPERVDQIRTIALKNGFDGVFAHKLFSEPKMLKMLETVNTAKKNNDKKALNRFKAKLAKMSEKEIYQIDHASMTWLVNNFTQENFDKVNNLRAFWGLKAVISEESLIDKNLREIRRMEFSHSVSETDKDNPHYEHTYSDAYKNFVPDYNEEFGVQEYTDVLASSQAVQLLEEHGFSSFVEQLPGVLKRAHVPPSLVPKLYVKDLQHLLIEQHSQYIRKRERRSIFDLDEVDIKHEADEVRATFWREVVKDKDLVKFISQDLKKKGINQKTISEIWERAEWYGNPNALVYDDCEYADKVRDVYFNVHHRVALKDGGTNTPDNFVIVIRMPGVVDSHSPLHEYDNPLVHLYKHEDVGEDGIIISDKPKSKKDKEIRLNTVFVIDEENARKNINKCVLYYGGPKTSMYVGKTHHSVRSALNNIDNTYKKISERIKEARKKKKETPQNYTIDQSKEAASLSTEIPNNNEDVSPEPERKPRARRPRVKQL